MKKQKKFLAVLSAAAVSTMIAAAVSTTAFAKTTDVIAKIDGQEVKINFEELTTAYENKAAGLDSELFNKYNEREGLTALLDDKNGFVDYKAVQEAAEDAVALGEKFVLNDFTETTEKTLADFKPEAEWKDDKVVPVTPVEEDLKVESVSAINTPEGDKLEVVLSDVPEEKPTATSVTVTRTINGEEDASFVWGGGVSSWNEETKTLTISEITPVEATEEVQEVVYSVAYGDTDAVAANALTVEAVEKGLAVESVSAINAKEVEITFNKAVDESTVIDSSNPAAPVLKSGVFTFTSIGHTNNVVANAAAAKLSKDGKTLTIVPDTFFNGDYAVTITKDVKDTDGNAFGGYSELVSLKDDVRPSVAGVTYPVNGTARITFSEPVNANDAAIASALTITKDKDGSSIAVIASEVTVDTDDYKSFDLDISGFTAKENYTVKLVGLRDFAGNLISPNPTTLTVVNSVVDDVKPEVVGVEVKSDTLFTIQFSEELGAVPTVTLDGTDVTDTTSGAALGTVQVDTQDKTKYNVTLASSTTGLHTVGVAANFTDKSGNANPTAWSKLVEFKADTTAPKYVSHEVKTLADGKQYLIVKFDEKVKVGSATNAFDGTYTDANSITHPVTVLVAKASVYDPEDAAATEAESIKIELDGLKEGSYTVELEAKLAEDLAGTPNASAAKTVTFTLGTVGDTTKPAIVDSDSNPSNGYSGITVQTNEDEVIVNFTEDVTPATALDVNNYLVEGVAVFEKAIFAGDAKTVKLTLKANAIDVDGDREFTIKNVADKAGNVMDTVTTQVAFVENVKPEITKAVLTSDKTIDVTFSEAMTDGTLTDNNDFEVYIDGEKATISTVAKASGNTYTITLDDTQLVVTDLSKPVIIKVLAGNDITDAASTPNSLATTGAITVAK